MTPLTAATHVVQMVWHPPADADLGANNDRVAIRWQSNLELRQENKIAKCLLCVAVKNFAGELLPCPPQQAVLAREVGQFPPANRSR
jgi:hypothetical protein